MREEYYPEGYTEVEDVEPRTDRKALTPGAWTIIKHFLLFVITFITVSTLVGVQFVGPTGVAETFMDLILWEGVTFAALFLTFLGFHEFGHYFAAFYHRINTTLPYFIPIPLFIGTMGAIIRIKERINETKKLFDIGVAGPLAGFVVCIIVLLYGFMTLPEPEYIGNFAGHDDTVEYIEENGTFPDEPILEEGGQLLVLGNTLLYDFMASFFDDAPPLWEVYHYPFLFAGWLGLFFTALNLMPVGQLDGGHILYALVGYKRHRVLARIFFGALVALGGAGAMPYLKDILGFYDLPSTIGAWVLWATISFFLLRKAYRSHSLWTMPSWLIGLGISALLIYSGFFPDESTRPLLWLFWSLLIVFIIGVEHPPVTHETPLTRGRKILGWISLAIFFLCISPNPIYILN